MLSRMVLSTTVAARAERFILALRVLLTFDKMGSPASSSELLIIFPETVQTQIS